MIERLGRRLRLVFQGRGGPPDPDAALRPVTVSRVVDFVAYGEDCRLSGRLSFSGDRLTDMLNEHEEYQLVDVLVQDLGHDRAIEVREVLVNRDDLLIVNATGPRGNQGRRQRTRLHPVALQLGPYHVRGYLHALPGADPVDAIRRRKPMVPLTEAWVDYEAFGAHQRERFGTVLVNREQMDWIVPALDEEVELPDLPLANEHGPLLKDFTGALFEKP